MQGVEVIAVNVLPERYTLAHWRGFWISVGGEPQVLFAQDVGRRAAAAFQVRDLGTTIIIDRQGNVVYRDWGPTAYARLRQEVDKVL